jgi:hypothetical protein
MAEPVKYIYGTETQILALTDESPLWFNRAFYYPSDKDYFYQLVDGVMVKYGGGSEAGVGIKLNNSVIGGVKILIEENDVLVIPANYDYNTTSLNVDGVINNDGQINII